MNEWPRYVPPTPKPCEHTVTARRLCDQFDRCVLCGEILEDVQPAEPRETYGTSLRTLDDDMANLNEVAASIGLPYRRVIEGLNDRVARFLA